MSELERITKQNQEARFNNQDSMNKNLDRARLVPSQPTTFVVQDFTELEAFDEDIDPTQPSSFSGRVPKDGDLAKTLGESINLDNEQRYFIRIDGEWVNILGLCSDDDANVQPIHGTRSSPGVSKCLAASDHRHGIPDSKTYLKKSLDENGNLVEDFVEYDNGSFFFDTVLKREYIKCNDRWICFSHVE